MDMQATEANEAIAALAETLNTHPAVADPEVFLGAVFAREMEASTGIGQGVAIPHARTPSVSDFVAAVGISRKGIEFQAADEKPVELVILMGIPETMVKEYLKLLAHLSLLLKQKDFIKSVLAAESPAEVVEAFASHEH
jgi:fructose-specific phosphotransferase system IIA component